MDTMDEERVKSIVKFAMLRSITDTRLLCESILRAYKYDISYTAYKDRPNQNHLWFNLTQAMHEVGIINTDTLTHLVRLMNDYYTGRDS